MFFARIFGTRAATVAATATAEAYNPAYSQTNLAAFIPTAPKCVKPFLVPNLDPRSGQHFVDETDGSVTPATPLVPSFLGEDIQLTSPCTGNGNGKKGCNLPGKYFPAAGNYLPMLVSGTHTYCPSDAAPGCGNGNSDFEKSTECCDGTPFDFKQCGASTASATWDSSVDPSGLQGPAQNGLQCLIHTTSNGPPPRGAAQQDVLDVTSFSTSTGPPKISPGSFSQGRYNNTAGLIDTSDSIITVPLFHVPKTISANSQLTIVGFLQLFVNYVKPLVPGPSKPDMDAYIVNVIGCGTSAASGSAVSGGGVSPIPVRLIHH